MIYEYRKINVARRAWGRVIQSVHGPVARTASAGGGAIWALGRGLLGAGSDEGTLMSVWPDGEVLAQRGAATFGAIDGVVESSNFARLEPTVRPTEPTPPSDPGLHVHRWFSLDDRDWAEFLDLSQHKIWPYMETFDCTILGLFRNVDLPPPECRVLLVTRYANMTEWDRSRPYGSAAPTGTSAALFEEARTATLRRGELTAWTIARVMTAE